MDDALIKEFVIFGVDDETAQQADNKQSFSDAKDLLYELRKTGVDDYIMYAIIAL